MDERRKFKRVQADLLGSIQLSNGMKVHGTVRNVSEGGVFFESDFSRLQKGDRVKLEFTIRSGGGMNKITTTTLVMHGASRIGLSNYGVGLEFMHLQDEHSELVNTFVDARPALDTH